MLKFNQIFLLTLSTVTVLCDVSHLPPEVLARHELSLLQKASSTTPPPPPHPYSFSYTAGRFPGHYDRTHSEIGDGSGTVKGSFSYVDPRQEVRTVEYVADEQGFHPALSHPAPAETVSVARARERHYNLYNKIAQEHASHPYPAVPYQSLPHDTVAVEHEKARHFTLYERIAADHARIAAEREAERRALGITEPNELQGQYYEQH